MDIEITLFTNTYIIIKSLLCLSEHFKLNLDSDLEAYAGRAEKLFVHE